MLLAFEIDVEVAIRAYADTKDPHEVATILSQSDTVREWRAAISHSRSWDEYIDRAKNYVRVIQAAASTKLQEQYSRRLKQKEISH